MPGIFDSKLFNADVFQGYVDRIPNMKLNRLVQSRAIRMRPDLAAAMRDQTGGNYITTTLRGLIGGTPKNYDGATTITGNKTKTFKHSRVVVGRANAWTEMDFSFDITGGEDFLENVAQQIADYWNGVDQDTIVHILNGVFNMTGTDNLEFVNNHTYDVTAITNANGAVGCVDQTTFNTAMQHACGANKGAFSLMCMHSVVSTNLENLKLLVYLKYNDANGMERELGLGTMNGRLVLVDDDMPATVVPATYVKTADAAIDSTKTYYTRSGSASAGYTYTAVASPDVASIGNYYEMTAAGYTAYTTYLLGDGAIEMTDCGAKVPYEVNRDPATNGGEDTLYSRQRKCFAPFGISFTMSSVATLSPTDAELETGANWELVNSQEATGKEYIDHRSIPIARVISRG